MQKRPIPIFINPVAGRGRAARHADSICRLLADNGVAHEEIHSTAVCDIEFKVFTNPKEIKKNCPGLELEVFVHGAMCVSVSGRCFLSQEAFGKSANRGECLQQCRRQYTITDQEEKHSFKMGRDLIMSPKD